MSPIFKAIKSDHNSHLIVVLNILILLVIIKGNGRKYYLIDNGWQEVEGTELASLVGQTKSEGQ